ncbi:hypothetical protein Tco_0231695 [Tanacetum coccineum]
MVRRITSNVMVSIMELLFPPVFGLKINFHKSNLFGVGVPFEEVDHFALTTGCNTRQTPFSYLGLPIDCNMAKTKSWDPIFKKFSKRLSKWKSLLLSIEGRSTLISSVLGSIGTYYLSLFPMPVTVNNKLESIRSNFFWGSNDNTKKISWISWKLVLASKEKGGLGIGSLYSLNHALIQKWQWHFFNNPQSLWVQLIKSIHGDTEDASLFFSHVRNQGGRQPSRLKALVSKLINALFLMAALKQGGIVFSPKKINNYIWIVLRDRLPTRWNLSQKGIDMDSLSCPICDSGIEFQTNHSLWTYTFGSMTCAFRLLGNLSWKLYAELFFGLCGIS